MSEDRQTREQLEIRVSRLERDVDRALELVVAHRHRLGMSCDSQPLREAQEVLQAAKKDEPIMLSPRATPLNPRTPGTGSIN